jgi:hypothetical protein
VTVGGKGGGEPASFRKPPPINTRISEETQAPVHLFLLLFSTIKERISVFEIMGIASLLRSLLKKNAHKTNDVVEEDMYGFYRRIESQSRVKKNYLNDKVRVILVDWLIEVHTELGFAPETLFLAVNIADRFLSAVVVPWSELQLVCTASLVIACKYEEDWFPSSVEFLYIPETDFTYLFDASCSQEKINSMEKKILNKLGWKIMVPTIHSFLVEILAFSGCGDTNRLLKNMAFYLGELAMSDYGTTTTYSPSMIAASAIYAARYCILKQSHGWEKALQKTGYSKRQLACCAKLLLRLAKTTKHGMPERKVFEKYSDSTLDAVALIP